MKRAFSFFTRIIAKPLISAVASAALIERIFSKFAQIWVKNCQRRSVVLADKMVNIQLWLSAVEAAREQEELDELLRVRPWDLVITDDDSPAVVVSRPAEVELPARSDIAHVYLDDDVNADVEVALPRRVPPAPQARLTEISDLSHDIVFRIHKYLALLGLLILILVLGLKVFFRALTTYTAYSIGVIDSFCIQL
jgi:hypothetical protein